MDSESTILEVGKGGSKMELDTYRLETPDGRTMKYLINTVGGELVDKPKSFGEIPEDKLLIVFYCESQLVSPVLSKSEFKVCDPSYDCRSKEFLLVDKTKMFVDKQKM